MISKKMVGLVKGSSVIRAMFEEGKKMAQMYGAENVFDFSLGNPNVPAPQAVSDNIVKIVKEENSVVLHGYMSNVGFEDVRDAIAKSLNKRFDLNLEAKNIVMTVGAAGGLNVIFKTLLDPNDEVITFAPFFGEYKNYVSNFDANLVVVNPNPPTFEPDYVDFEKKITERTKAVLVNNPNNPTGIIYKKEWIEIIASILEKKQKEYGTSIYLISDEPYRELVYGGEEVPYLIKYYRNTIVGYSYSKSLSLPGERIGYLVIPTQIDDYEDVFAAAGVATRILGFVNAPSLQQKLIKECLDEKTNIEAYNKNRMRLYEGLQECGFECVKPEGAFYLFMKAPIEDDSEFVKVAKEYNLLLVPASSFGVKGYVRIAYCVSYDTIERSMTAFRKLAQRYGLIK